MRRLSTTALDGVRRAVDETPALRARVADAAPTEADAGGRAPWLFLHRPEGWEEELASLAAEADGRSREVAEAADERAARRRLRVVEDELARVRAELADLRRSAGAVVALEAALAEERRRRAEVEATLAEVGGRVRAVERERDAAHRRASAADKALADAVRGHAEPPVDPARDLEIEGVRSSIRSAAAALDDAAAALEDATATLDRGTSRLPPPPATPTQTPSPPPRRLAGRVPAPVPPGLFDDDPVAADHLVRLRGAVLLVDGYNLSLRRWADLTLVEQRGRLVDALNGLAARTGVDIEVVFDGDDGGARGIRSRGGRRQAVRVTFSPGALEADDVLLDLVERTPISRPVVVATDDRRVQREAAARGANVVGSVTLFAVLGLGR